MPRGTAVVPYDGKRGRTWRIKYADAVGRQVMETIGAERDGITRKKAEAELRERLVRVERKSYRKPRSLIFGEYARTWLKEGERSQGWKPATVVAYRNALNRYLIPVFGATRLDGVRPRAVAAFINDVMTSPRGQHKKPLSGTYVNVILGVLHSVYKAALGEELVQANPTDGVRRPKLERYRPRILTPVEVSRVLAAFTDERARRVFLTLNLTGLRRSEIEAVRWRDVNLLEGTIRVAESKSEEGERLIALSPKLTDTLRQQYADTLYRADDDFVFAHPRLGNRMHHYWYTTEFRKALAAAGITDYVRPFHDARHGALTNLAAAGVSLVAIMGIAGHRSMETTRQYVHLAGVVFPTEAKALEEQLFGRGVEKRGRKRPRTQASKRNI